MNKVCGVDVVECLCNLVDNVTAVLFLEQILADERIEVDIHEFEEDVDVLLAGRADYFLQLHDVGVAEALQEHYLTVGALGVSGVLEGVEVLLQRKGLSRLPLHNLPDDAVRPVTQLLLHLEPLQDVLFQLLILSHIKITACRISAHRPKVNSRFFSFLGEPTLKMSLATFGCRPLRLWESVELDRISGRLICLILLAVVALGSFWLESGVAQYSDCAICDPLSFSAGFLCDYWLSLPGDFRQSQAFGSQKVGAVLRRSVYAFCLIGCYAIFLGFYLLSLFPPKLITSFLRLECLCRIKYSSSIISLLFFQFSFYLRCQKQGLRAGKSPKNCFKERLRQSRDLGLELFCSGCLTFG